jgi:hypothetical protein
MPASFALAGSWTSCVVGAGGSPVVPAGLAAPALDGAVGAVDEPVV